MVTSAQFAISEPVPVRICLATKAMTVLVHPVDQNRNLYIGAADLTPATGFVLKDHAVQIPLQKDDELWALAEGGAGAPLPNRLSVLYLE